MVARGASSKDGLGVGGSGLGIPHMPVPVVLKLDLHPTNLGLGGRISGIHSMMKCVGSFWSGEVLQTLRKVFNSRVAALVALLYDCRFLLCSLLPH